MTKGHIRPFMPYGVWPEEMRAETAAAFCDEPSVEAFKAKVERGVYSQPRRQKGCLPKWHRERLTMTSHSGMDCSTNFLCLAGTLSI